MSKPANRQGPFSTYTPQMGEEICAWIAEGKPLRAFCRQEGKPAWRTVFDWIRREPAFAEQMEIARSIGADAIAEETLEIVDTEAEVVETQYGSYRDGSHVTWLKNRAEQRLKLLAKWHPKKYGDKIGIGQADGMAPVALKLAGSDVDG